jgi:outer membrane receptor protein involved in Fe transport
MTYRSTNRVHQWLLVTSAALPLGLAAPAYGQTAAVAAPQPVDNGDIIVTAQKRSESVNSVPISITALSGNTMAQRGISSVADLVKAVPSLNVATTAFGLPVYTIRGIGFYEQSLAASPTISSYTDEVPLAFPVISRLTAFDLERVEVLKGPQGILFGQNSTGGAINQVAGKPSATFGAGARASYGRFGVADGEGYVTGALSSTVNARLAAKVTSGGNWQHSVTRNDEMGQTKQYAARALFDIRPSDTLKVSVNLNGWRDRSDTQASQMLFTAQVGSPASCTPANANYPDNCVLPAVARTPRPTDARGADWNPAVEWKRNDYMYQGSVRADLELPSNLKATSITAYTKYRQRQLVDQDGTAYRTAEGPTNGDIRSVFQELRIATDAPSRLRFIAGANFEHDKIYNSLRGPVDGGAPGFAIADSSSRGAISKAIPALSTGTYANSKIRTLAVFGNATFELTKTLSVQGGLRFTDVKTDYSGCNADSGDGSEAANFNFLIGRLTGTPGTIQPGQCFTMHPSGNPVGSILTPGLVVASLHENNVSWKVGIDYKPQPGSLLYANVSRGYKSGSFPLLTSTTDAQLRPAKQESVLAFEVGGKLSLLDRKLQLNAAAFYYDYSDKQVLGRVLESFRVFGALQTLVNVPKSRLYGFEGQAIIRPARGLTFDLSATYLNSKVTGSFSNYDPFGNAIDFKGLQYPFTPKFSAVGDVSYEFPVSQSANLFVGTGYRYQTKIITVFAIPSILTTTLRDPLNFPGARVPANAFNIPGYGVVDARFGVADSDGRWRATGWIRNLTNKYYFNNIQRAGDGVVGWAGMPITYGFTLEHEF